MSTSIRELETKADYAGVMESAREMLAKDRRNFQNAELKGWCGRRFRNLFIQEAMKIPAALDAVDKKLLAFTDHRTDAQKIAERYLRGTGPAEHGTDMPAPRKVELKNTTLLFCPGMLNGLLPVRAFQEALPNAEKNFGWKILRADLHPMRSCEANMEDLDRALDKGEGLRADCSLIKEGEGTPPGDVFLICYSKGMPDVLEYLIRYPERAARIRCIFNWAGAVGGSYLADDIYNSLQGLPVEMAESGLKKLLTLVSPVISFEDGSLRRAAEFDILGCVRDVTTPVRAAFNEKNAKAIEELGIPIFNITGSTTPLESPYFQMQGVLELNKYDANNDMQLTQEQSKVKSPIACDIAMLRGHHWDISYSPFPGHMRFGSPNLDHPFPKDAALIAMTSLAAELGLID